MANETARTPMKGDGKVKFMAHLEAFKDLLAAGHQQRKMFETYASELGISYSQFNRYVNQHIREKNSDGHQKESLKQGQQQTVAPTTTTGTGEQAKPNPAASTSNAGTARAGKKQPVFQHNPSSGHNLDDLV